MLKKQLGRTGLEVSLCCLGTMTFGKQNTQDEGFEQMDYAIAAGVNFFDTAEMYAIPPTPETYGQTETIIGNWFKARQNRDKIVLATKIAGRSPMSWCREAGGETRVNEAQIDEAIEKSLRRLQTNYIDLYQIHWPDRRVDMFGSSGNATFDNDYIAFEVTLAALDKHVKKGNICHIGVSNETSWGTMQFLIEAEKNGLPRIASIQNAYHLLNRNFETGLSEIAQREDVGLLAYSPLAQGYLTGKYQNGARPEGARTTLFNRGQRYETPSAEATIDKYLELAKEIDLTPSQLALQFCATRPFMTSVIIGATKMEQLREDIGAFDVEWNKEIEHKVNSIHKSCPNPCP
ncbi:MAG: aldo/keto reductase [Hyphomonadaceae bacterium]|nr:MAG: aldo/keto reductase [Hyphomonadaceae bacterium]KAF0187118.1 MAG: aldo/keto reductase [Hyphomonadaceae bacterium]